ncbi:MAG: roadblock/LC7 domain-containing protein [Planctomycetota bacterium]|nr:roadblock/LC7 domain-containing protein [Planctomycetota bacterium]
MENFLKLSDSKANILIDKDGHMVTKAGATEDMDLLTISALVAGSFAATREMAKLLGEEEFSVLFHQGKKDSVQLSLIGDRTLLATIFDERTTIGMVRLYAKEATAKLMAVFRDIDSRADDGGEKVAAELGDYQEKAQEAVDEFFSGE